MSTTKVTINDLKKNEVFRFPQKDNMYFLTTWTQQKDDQYYADDTKFSYLGKHLRDESKYGNYYSIFLNSDGKEIKVIHQSNTAFYHIDSDSDITKLNIATKLEVVCEPQEARYYYLTTFTEETGNDKNKHYFTTNPLTYLGRYTGSRAEGWGNEMKTWDYFINDNGEGVIIKRTKLTAFYHIKYIPVVRPPSHEKFPLPTQSLPPPVSSCVLFDIITKNGKLFCPACINTEYRIHTCSD
jgi:hypothetical protein